MLARDCAPHETRNESREEAGALGLPGDSRDAGSSRSWVRKGSGALEAGASRGWAVRPPSSQDAGPVKIASDLAHCSPAEWHSVRRGTRTILVEQGLAHAKLSEGVWGTAPACSPRRSTFWGSKQRPHFPYKNTEWSSHSGAPGDPRLLRPTTRQALDLIVNLIRFGKLPLIQLHIHTIKKKTQTRSS